MNRRRLAFTVNALFWLTLPISAFYLLAAGVFSPSGQPPTWLSSSAQAYGSAFALVSALHSAITGLVAVVATWPVKSPAAPPLTGLSPARAAHLVKLIGYLYTLVGLIVAFSSLRDRNLGQAELWYRLMPGIAGAIFTSLIGWFLGGWIDRDDDPIEVPSSAPQVQVERLALDLQPALLDQLARDLTLLSSTVRDVTAQTSLLGPALVDQTRVLTRANELLAAVETLLHHDAASRLRTEELHARLQRHLDEHRTAPHALSPPTPASPSVEPRRKREEAGPIAPPAPPEPPPPPSEPPHLDEEDPSPPPRRFGKLPPPPPPPPPPAPRR